MIDTQDREISFTVNCIRRAALLVKQVQSEMVGAALTKVDRSPVTVADFAAQALVASMLEMEFPEDPLVAEEDADSLREQLSSTGATLQQVTGFVSQAAGAVESLQVCDWIDRGASSPGPRFWTLDPIDGTKGFLRGEQYAVAMALLIDGEVQIGALGCPNLSLKITTDEAAPTITLQPDLSGTGVLIIALRGQGSWATQLDRPGEYGRLSVSRCTQAPYARLLRSVESGHTNVGQIEEFSRRLGLKADPVSMDSQAKYAVLASGGGELLVRLLSPDKPHYREKIWDHAAGALILEEAGGQISDLEGKNLDFTAGRTLAHNRGVLASNGFLHQDALQVLEQIAV